MNLTLDTPVIEYEERVITCETTSANPPAVLTLYQSGTLLSQSAAGETLLSFTYTVSREMNGYEYSCSATSSDTNMLAYTVTSKTETTTVWCKLYHCCHKFFSEYYYL